MAKKKKPASNPARGFATTSIASKPKVVEPPPREPTPPPVPTTAPAVEEWKPPTAEEEEDLLLRSIVDKHGVKVRKESARIATKLKAEKRTLRGSGQCYPLKLDAVFGIFSERSEGAEQSLGEKILQMAKEEMRAEMEKRAAAGEADEKMLVNTWTLHRIMLGLGFKENWVEAAVKEVLGREGRADRDVEALLDEVMEWMAMYGEVDDMPRYLEAPANAAPKKTTPDPSRKETAKPNDKQQPLPTGSKASKKPLPKAPRLPPTLQSEETTISSLALESLDISDEGELNGTCSSDASDTSEDDDSDEELTPESLIPKYIKIQTRLYKIHPSTASVIVGGKKVKGGGKKPTKQAPRPPPSDLPEAKKKKVKDLQQKLKQLEADPLFDSYEADTTWRDERAKLDEESWEKKQESAEKSKKTPRKQVKKEEEDEGLFGGMFEGPPTEETVGHTGANIKIRDFEVEFSGAGNIGGTAKAGVAAAAMRKLCQDKCKDLDANSFVRFEKVSGTSISQRSRLNITWSNMPELDLDPEPEVGQHDERDVVIRIPQTSKPTTIFEMNALAGPTKEQADGYIITYALFKLFGKKEEKLYLRLPTVWRNVWDELAQAAKAKSEDEERKVLKTLKGLIEPPTDAATRAPPVTGQKPSKPEDAAPLEEEDEPTKKYKPSYERYLEGEQLQEDWARRRATPQFQKMEEYRRNLPMWNFRDEIIGALEGNQIIVLCGETGCGKSTQLPAFLLEHEMQQGRPCKIYCTEPRRISALSLAKRVAEELGDGKKVGGLVGYSIRLENMVSDQTKLIYATTGIVMRMLERTPDLAEVTHLVLDEVHERSIESDFLLVVLKRLLVKRKDLKVVLMSATVNAERFSDYLGGAPILRVPGRTFPVQEYFLEDAVETTGYKEEDGGRGGRKNVDDNDAEIEEGGAPIGTENLKTYSAQTRSTLTRMDERQIPYELILELLVKLATAQEYVEYSKAILVFLPGMGEIRRLNDMILGHPMFGFSKKNMDNSWVVYPLHSTIASEDQEQAFVVPPPGVRKIVLATNIAETGITIPDITAVIDTGKHKEMRFDEKRQLSRLVEVFISRANAKQRRGRAGRVQPGICFHLFTRDRFQTQMAEQQTPEIMRLSLQDLCLRVKICGLGNVEEVLTSALDAPTPKNIRRAVESLVDVKALTQGEELTPLGRQLSKLPLDVYLGKLVLFGSLFSCLDATVTIAALLTSKSPFVSPIGYGAEANAVRLSFKRGDSDLLTGYNAYCSWRRVAMARTMSEAEFCRKNYLSSRILANIEDLKTQLFASLVDAGFLTLTGEERGQLNRARYSSYYRRNFFLPPEASNRNSDKDSIVSACIAAAFYPKLLARDGRGWRNILSNNKLVRVHHNSVNSTPPSTTSSDDADWLAYYSLMQTRNGGYDAHETTIVKSLVVALLCGEAEWRLWSGVLNVDGNRVRFSLGDWRGLIALKWLRKRVGEVVRRSWRNPERGMGEGEKWVGVFWEAVAALEKTQGSK